MKISLLSREDGRGGAYAAAYRLHKGLRQAGADSTMIVSEKKRDDDSVLADKGKLANIWAYLAPKLNNLPPNLLYPERENAPYSIQWLPDVMVSKVAQQAPDVINLHLICGGYIQIETLPKFEQPLVWTLHDMWAFTGGCHYNQYSQDCDRYLNSCGACPQLHSSKDADLSRWVWQRKAKAWKNLNLTVVTPSHWLAKCARKSALFKDFPVVTIPYSIETERYKPVERQVARSILNLPQDKQLILFGSTRATTDIRKGFPLLQKALQELSKSSVGDRLELVVFGSSKPSTPTDLGFPANYLGVLNDDISLALVYAAADVFVLPSTQDNLPNTVLEAIACGTPCVGFNIGGMPDMIEHQRNGYLAQPFQVEDLARGMVWVLENQERHQKLCIRSREKAEEEFAMDRQASRYLSLFTEVLEKNRTQTK